MTTLNINDLPACGDNLPSLGNAFNVASNRLIRTLSAYAIYTTATAYVPEPHAPEAVLDAWADYMIARRNYERALIRSRRGK